MPRTVIQRLRRFAVALPALLCLAATDSVVAQQQTPPTPAQPITRVSPAARTLSPHVTELAQRKSALFRGLAMTEGQQNTLLSNLGSVGCEPMKVMQQTMPVPPALASGEACRTHYSGTPEQLSALRSAVERMVRQNKPSDVPVFTSNIPKECPYKELYYYLAVIEALPQSQ